jgi:hypothetical protein
MSGPFNYIPFGDNPGQVCQIVSQDTYATNDVALSGLGGGGGEFNPNPAFSTVITSTINASTIVTRIIEVALVDVYSRIEMDGPSVPGALSLIGRISTTVNVDSLADAFSVYGNNGGVIRMPLDTNLIDINGTKFNPVSGDMRVDVIAQVSTINFSPTNGAISSISSINGVNFASISTLIGAL